MVKKIAIFASGSGSNAEKIFEYFNNKSNISVALLLTNNPNAYVIERAKKYNIPCIVFGKDDFYNTSSIIDMLKLHNIDLIILAGFLWLVPSNLIQQFPEKIINIHPSLLPKFGGKGMYGDYVHKAVLDAKETQTGITIHLVNEHFDEGRIIKQFKCSVSPKSTLEDIKKSIQELEHQNFAPVIEEFLESV